ncbi:hypothetical protein KQX54_021194 [Cotesia glomerata]|uniref:Uncharacterized protein n=1 Tax=Cotesia glomerata TaxID=32391 RepID=A0AAV7J9Y8_COTGL|nr:hypothetical protein KQX54_021194 [Cotesia glomerata]
MSALRLYPFQRVLSTLRELNEYEGYCPPDIADCRTLFSNFECSSRAAFTADAPIAVGISASIRTGHVGTQSSMEIAKALMVLVLLP